jgi:hypothetical protein
MIDIINDESKVKHKDIPPWVRYKGLGVKSRNPISFCEKEYHGHNTAMSFIWVLYWAIEPDHKFKVSSIINYWWSKAYTKPFPEDGGQLDDLTERIYHKLIDIGHESQNIEPLEKDYTLPTILTNKSSWYFVKDDHINKHIIEEADMARILKKGKVKKVQRKEPVSKSQNDDAIVKDDTKASKFPSWVNSSKPGSKAHDSKVRICELLMEQKFTDSEIAEKILSGIEYKVTEDRVSFYRKTLNKGHFEPLGFPKPDKPIMSIKNDAKKTKKLSIKKK